MNTKFGFYKIGDFVTLSKIEAIELHRRTKIHPQWIFNDEAFSACDWSVEPSVSLEEIYKRRALQLREKYDYIVLFFSGGADSTNVLHSFINNNIHVDELLCYHTKSVAGEHGVGEQEIFRVAVPTAKRAQEINPNIKIREIDLTKNILEFYQDKKNKFDLLYDKNDYWSPNHMGLTSLSDHIPEWKQLADKGKRICLLRGADKPQIFYDDQGWHVKFLDILVGNSIDIKSVREKNLWFDHEFFYWTPDLPDVIIKQAHVVKHFLQTAKSTSPGLSLQPSFFQAKTINGKKYYMTCDQLHRLIYPTWDINTFTMGKHSTPLASPRDSWFFSKTEFAKESEIARMNLQAVKQIVGDYWLNDRDHITAGLKGMWSKSYYF
jgi:hypothetical protein